MKNSTKVKSLTNPCWQWYYALVGGSDHGRWIGAHPWNFPLWLPMMAPFGPWQRLNFPLWRYLYKSICQMPPWCGRDRGSAGCWWCRTCALQSDIRRTCNHRDKVRMRRGCGHSHIWALHMTAYFLWAWKEANVKLLPWYSPKNLLSSKRMWCTSLAEQRR